MDGILYIIYLVIILVNLVLIIRKNKELLKEKELRYEAELRALAHYEKLCEIKNIMNYGTKTKEPAFITMPKIEKIIYSSHTNR